MILTEVSELLHFDMWKCFSSDDMNALLPGVSLPTDMAPGPVKSPILPSGNLPLSSFLGPLGMERESSVMGAQTSQLTPPGLQGLTTSILGSVISRIQKPNQADNGPPSSGVSVGLCLQFVRALNSETAFVNIFMMHP